ncbi:MAG: iron ABC transporter permease [Thermoplasmata archaeon]|nr:iron ABC transporter permease [Thermoplasmata archaeon]WII07129.1 iron ABC transporter permease [Methanomassiliicoccales archaeon LGM-RCC1]
MIEEIERTGKEQYKSSIARKFAFLAICLIALIITTLVSCSVGTGYEFTKTAQVIWDHITGVTYEIRSPDWWADYYIFNNVMPGVIMALIAGAGLALAGTVMQSMMENPLADAYTTGISSGACLGAVVAIIMGFSYSTVVSGAGIVINAFIGSLIPAVIVILMVRFVGNSPSTIILIGTALTFFFNSLVTLVMITASTESLQDAYIWQVGSVTNASWADMPLMLVMTVASAILVQLSSSKLNIMALGEKSAKSLGLDVVQFRMLCIILTSVLIASIISFTGIIGFIGLVAPHMTRYLVGGDNKFVVPGSIILGSTVLVIADLVSRLLTGFGYIPLGVVMSFIGAPVFLYLIVRRKAQKEVF